MKNKISTSILVKEHKVGILRINDIDYISLTDLAMYDNEEKPSDTIIHWMSNISTYNYISLWEKINNKNFNFAESREIKNNELTKSSFTLSPTRWIKCSFIWYDS